MLLLAYASPLLKRPRVLRRCCPVPMLRRSRVPLDDARKRSPLTKGQQLLAISGEKPRQVHSACQPPSAPMHMPVATPASSRFAIQSLAEYLRELMYDVQWLSRHNFGSVRVGTSWNALRGSPCSSFHPFLVQPVPFPPTLVTIPIVISQNKRTRHLTALSISALLEICTLPPSCLTVENNGSTVFSINAVLLMHGIV